MPHGFLSYNLPLGRGMSQAVDAIGQVFLSIKDLCQEGPDYDEL